MDEAPLRASLAEPMPESTAAVAEGPPARGAGPADRGVIEILPSRAASPTVRDAIVAVCSEAYGEPFAPYLDGLPDPVHVLARVDGVIVSHAAWVTRELRVDGLPAPLRAAYIEAVATAPRFRSRGLASRILRGLPALLAEFDIAALSPSDPAFYARLGWEPWRGPLSYREGDRVVPTPDEVVMIHRLPKTPTALDLAAGLQVDWRTGEVW
jgi:aminoglycoside 2'-N-acetyltransferase I